MYINCLYKDMCQVSAVICRNIVEHTIVIVPSGKLT